MSDTEGTSELKIPVQYGQRRVLPRKQTEGQPGRKNRQPRPMVGGDVVGSMKRGIKDHSGDVRRRESRMLVLYSVAGALFCVLTAIWLKKLYTHWYTWSQA